MIKNLFFLTAIFLITLFLTSCKWNFSYYPENPEWEVEKYFIPGDNFENMEIFDNNIYCGGSGGVYKLDYENKKWNLMSDYQCVNFHFFNKKLYVLTGLTIENVNDEESIKIEDPSFVKDFLIDENRIFIASYGLNHGNPTGYDNGIMISEDKGLTWREFNDGIITKAVIRIKKSKEGDIFCLSEDGVYYLDENKWKLLFELPDQEYGEKANDFDFYYDSSEKLKYIFAGGDWDYLSRYNYQNGDLKVIRYRDYLKGDLGTEDIFVDSSNKKLVIAHAYAGFSIWDVEQLNLQKYVDNDDRYFPFHIHSIAYYDSKIITGNYGGAISSCIFDLESGKYEIVNNGIESQADIRTVIFDNSKMICGNAVGGFLIKDLLTENITFKEVYVNGTKFLIGESFWVQKRDNFFYFQDYDFGFWKTLDFNDFERIIFKDSEGRILHGYGSGDNFYLCENGLLYVLSPESYYGNHEVGSFICFDLNNKILLYEGSGFGDVIYGLGGGPFAVSKKDETRISVSICSYKNGNDLYFSLDAGKNWTYYDSSFNPYTAWYDDKIVYCDDENMILFNPITNKKSILEYIDIIPDAFIVKKNYLFCNYDGKILIYDLLNEVFSGYIESPHYVTGRFFQDHGDYLTLCGSQEGIFKIYKKE